jgi:hypothetical protein
MQLPSKSKCIRPTSQCLGYQTGFFRKIAGFCSKPYRIFPQNEMTRIHYISAKYKYFGSFSPLPVPSIPRPGPARTVDAAVACSSKFRGSRL